MRRSVPCGWESKRHSTPQALPSVGLSRRACAPVPVFLALVLILGAMLAAACSSPPEEIHLKLEVDGKIYAISTTASTVREVLAQAGVELGPYDRVEPDLWEEVSPGITIRVIRVQYELETETRPIPYQRRVIRSEALAPGEKRLVQPGADGTEELVYRITVENGVETERQLVSTRVITPAMDEIVVVGIKSSLPSVPFSGTIAYLSGGNAWIMREASGTRRPLTTFGDLDGRVLALSPDGRYLLFTRKEESPALNSLWVVTATIAGAEPVSLPITGVLYAEWAPQSPQDGEYIFAYSTGEGTAASPGWRAHNDLWLARWRPFTPEVDASPVITAWEDAPYGWWGVSYRWIPGGELFAYATAEEVGVVDVETGRRTALLKFAPLYTYSEWVWVPHISPSPDGKFIAATVHGKPLGDEPPQDSPVFDVWVLSTDGKVEILWAQNTGMWAAPHWSPSYESESGGVVDFVVYGQANEPFHSQTSRYRLYVADRDGSNRRVIFPPPMEPGLADPSQLDWSPYGPAFVVSYQGNLYLVDVKEHKFHQLTEDGNSYRPQWAR